MNQRLTVALLLMLAGTSAAAQVQSRPTDPPLVTAANESWYRLAEPVQFAGELYYRGGPAVFFNGNTMVRIGHYNGVPLYADTTVEPFSVVLVPITRGLLQPYERPRRGDLAGTTGSHPLSFPVHPVPESASMAMAAGPPTAPSLPIGAISVYTPERTARATMPAQEAVGTTGVAAGRVQIPRPVVTLRRPEGNDGVWIRFRDRKWVSAGAAVPMTGADFVRVGEYAGFPVFRRRDGRDDTIYLPTRAGLVAPYRAKRQ